MVTRSIFRLFKIIFCYFFINQYNIYSVSGSNDVLQLEQTTSKDIATNNAVQITGRITKAVHFYYKMITERTQQLVHR